MIVKSLAALSNMPQLSAPFSSWTKTISLTKRTETITNGLVGYTEEVLVFRGIIQPLSAEEIALKPDAQRSWKWLQIHCQNGSLSLTTNDQILYGDVLYKVMAVKDYSLNGYLEFHCVSEYQS